MPALGPAIDSPQVKAIRAVQGGQLSMLPVTQTRWHLSDLEYAESVADTGDLSVAGRLMRSVRKDGTFAGVLSTRTGGLVRLPKKFQGDPDIVAQLELGHDSVRSVFDEMCPPTELANFLADGILLGVAVAELVQVPGRDYPVFVRLEPENLRYRWHENRWYYVSIAGMLPITPGDGKWVLHTPGGRIAPWQNGLWRAVGQAWIDKQHARLHKSNWESKLANPARVAVSPQGAGEKQKQSWFRAVMAWGVNTVFGVTPGYDVKLLESNGRGYECFLETIKTSDRDMVIALSASTVLVDGGTGFANADVHAAIRQDLIQCDAEGLAYTINTQVIPPWVLARWGEEGLEQSGLVEWDVTAPEDLSKTGTAIAQAGTAISTIKTALEGTGVELDVPAFTMRFGIPTKVASVQPQRGEASNDTTEDGSVDVDMSEAA
jgi:phage gp29-like protein